MFALFKKKKLYRNEAITLFQRLQKQSRHPYFFADLMVPDTTEGRFDILTLHLFLIMNRIKDDAAGKAFSQALFDVTFESIDQGYREIGVSDMGVPKRMKKLMLAFNGRIHAYAEALEQGQSALEAAIDRNIYDTVHFNDSQKHILGDMACYTMQMAQYLRSIDVQSIMDNLLEFNEPGKAVEHAAE